MRLLKENLDFKDLVSRVLAFDYLGALVASLMFPLFLVPKLGLVRTSMGVAIIVGEFLIHYHLDWFKAQVMGATGWTPKQSPFWWAIGADQLGHHLTYAAIIAILASTTG